MKHLKPTLVMIVIIAPLSAALYWPMEVIITLIAIGILMLWVLVYFALYDYFNN
jgi:hypothetical protein